MTANIAPMNWETITGAITHVGTSFDSIWAINHQHNLYQCKLPCDGETNYWSVIPESNFKAFSVNPFEIWTVSPDSSLYRCKFPCKTLRDFQLVTTGVRKVALGLDRIWLISKDYRVGRTLLNFENLGRFMDVRVLKWKPLYGNVKQLSIGEDNEVWAIRENDNRLIRYDRSSQHWYLVDNIKAKKVSVGSDYIYITDMKDKAMRCSRPCWQVEFVPLGRKLRNLSAEMSGPGVVYGALYMKPFMPNLIVGFAVGNRTGFQDEYTNLNATNIPWISDSSWTPQPQYLQQPSAFPPAQVWLP